MKGLKCLWQSKSWAGLATAIALGSTTLAAGIGCLTPSPASAQAAYGSYVGIGPSIGLTDGSVNEDSQNALVIAARYKLLKLPISLRAQALILNDNTAIVPTVSYDIPLNWQADAYIGAGYSFSDGDSTSPLGNQDAFAIQPGIDYALPNSKLVVFGNAIIAFDAYRETGGTAVSVQGGVGLRF
jgi:hypothetical protein